MGKIFISYDHLPEANKKVYDLIQKEKDGNVSAFASEIGVSQQVLDRIFKEDKRNGKYPSVSESIKEGIKLRYGLDEDWLYSKDKCKVGFSQNVSIDDEYTTWLLPQSAMGGSLSGFAVEGATLQNCEKVISPIKGVDFAISVYGESMAPEYPSGSRVLIKKINPDIFIDWGKVYVLDTSNGVIIKEVIVSPKEGCIRCHSINPDPKYSDFDVPMDEIYGIYRVLMCLSAK